MARGRTHNAKPITIPMLDMKAIGRRVARCRLNRGWTQEGLARATGLSRHCIVGIEFGNRVPAIRTVIALSVALRVSIDYLLYGVSRRGTIHRLAVARKGGAEAALPLRPVRAQT